MFFLILLNKFHMCVHLYYKLILINKFIKYNYLNNSYCILICLSIFSLIILFIINNFFLFFYTIGHDLDAYINFSIYIYDFLM